MFKKALVMAALAASLLIPSLGWSATEDSTDITINATVDSYFVWNIASHTVLASAWTGGTSGHMDRTHLTLDATLAIAATTNAAAVVSFTPTAGADTTFGRLTHTDGVRYLKTSFTLDDDTTGFLTDGNTTLGTFVEADGTNSAGIFAAGVDWNLAPNTLGDSSFNLKVKAEMHDSILNPKAGNYQTVVQIRATW